VGLTAFVTLLGATLWTLADALTRCPDDYRLLGLTSGIVAFLLTCVTGHPLLVPEVAVPFWLVGGLGVVLAAHIRAGGAATNSSGWRPLAIVAIAATMLLAVSVPFRARDTRPAPKQTRGVTGLYDWEVGEDGRIYRWTEQFASVFVEPDVRRVQIPMRAPGTEKNGERVSVEITIDGHRPATWQLTDEWKNVVADLPPTGSIPNWSRRINIKTSRIRPLVARSVGVQLGQPTIVTD
jgi:hypothetical protein